MSKMTALVGLILLLVILILPRSYPCSPFEFNYRASIGKLPEGGVRARAGVRLRSKGNTFTALSGPASGSDGIGLRSGARRRGASAAQAESLSALCRT